MTYADVVGQMQAIQAVLAQYGVTQAATTGTSTGAASFASALSSATATDTTRSATATAATGGTAVSTAASSSAATGGATGDDVVQAALGYVGTPYVLGGESTSGIDCSGLVQAACKRAGIDVPRLVHEQATVGQPVASLKDARPGDLIVLNGGDHIAIYLGNDTVIHAPYPGRSVSVQKAWFTDKDIVTIRRVAPAETATATSTDASAATTSSSLSIATVARATALLGMLGSMSGDSSTGSTGSTGLSGLLSSFGITASSGSSTASAELQAALAGTATT